MNIGTDTGQNILDGFTGSNFLIGSTSGTDTVDDRSTIANVWSTVVNFHSGDTATIWGITQADFKLVWLSNQGAPGATGLTGVLVPNGSGQQQAAVTLAVFTPADLTNGRLSISYNMTADQPGLPGSPYLSIHAT